MIVVVVVVVVGVALVAVVVKLDDTFTHQSVIYTLASTCMRIALYKN